MKQAITAIENTPASKAANFSHSPRLFAKISPAKTTIIGITTNAKLRRKPVLAIERTFKSSLSQRHIDSGM
jgi:hypothetical protein